MKIICTRYTWGCTLSLVVLCLSPLNSLPIAARGQNNNTKFSLGIRMIPFSNILIFILLSCQFCASFNLPIWKVKRKRQLSLNAEKNSNKRTDSLGFDPQDNDALLDYSIDSFLRGDYEGSFSDDAASPLPQLSPRETVENALNSLRALDDPEPSHGAAVMLRFCAPLSRGERWGSIRDDNWKEILRGSVTPTMLARRIRASEFSPMLDFAKLDVTDGTRQTGRKDLDGLPSIAFVNAALYFEDEVEPSLLTFQLKIFAGVWLIDTIRKSDKNLFMS